MGLYPINCPSCGILFMWFSGNLPDQRCDKCKGEVVARFKEPLKAMRGRVYDLEVRKKENEHIAQSAAYGDDVRKLYGGLARAIEREIAEYNAAIEYLEAAATK